MASSLQALTIPQKNAKSLMKNWLTFSIYRTNTLRNLCRNAIDSKGGIDFNYPGQGGNTILHKFAANGDKRAVKLSIKYHADPSIKNSANKTPLDLARNGLKEFKECLKDGGKIPEYVSDFMKGYAETIALLKEIEEEKNLTSLTKAQKNAKSLMKYTPTLSVYGTGSLASTCQHIIDHMDGIDFNYQDQDGNTVLHRFAANGDKKAVELSIKHHADPFKKNNANKTPLDLARKGLAEFNECFKTNRNFPKYVSSFKKGYEQTIAFLKETEKKKKMNPTPSAMVQKPAPNGRAQPRIGVFHRFNARNLKANKIQPPRRKAVKS
jgi:hypothetical protein